MSSNNISLVNDPNSLIVDDQIHINKNTFVAAIVFLVGFFGIFSNMLAMLIVLKNPLFRNSFGVLCFSHSIANIGVLLTFVAWVGPLTLAHADELSEGFWGKHIGQINMIFWDVCVYSHLAISINRFISIAFPLRSPKILNKRNTVGFLVVVWSLGMAHGTPYFWDEECFIAYSPSSWTWNFPDTECGYMISTYFDYYTGVGTFIIIFMIDFTTLFKLRHLNNAVARMNNGVTPSSSRRRAEVKLFMQTCVQGALFFYELLHFYYICTLFVDPLAVYMTSTFAWEICHAADGLVVVLFHFKSAFCHSNRPQNEKTSRIFSPRGTRTISGFSHSGTTGLC